MTADSVSTRHDRSQTVYLVPTTHYHYFSREGLNPNLMKKRALITGITGQDGSYLAELLLQKGYDVYGLVRRTSTLNFERIRHIQDQITLVSGDILDQTSMTRALSDIRPEEIYNLAA